MSGRGNPSSGRQVSDLTPPMPTNVSAPDPTAGERIKAGRTKHGVGPSDYLPGNIQHLVSPVVGILRLKWRDGEAPSGADMEWFIDRLGLVLDLAREADALPATPDADDASEPLTEAEREATWQTIWQALADHQWEDWECSCGGVRKDSGEHEDNHLADVFTDLFAARDAEHEREVAALRAIGDQIADVAERNEIRAVTAERALADLRAVLPRDDAAGGA